MKHGNKSSNVHIARRILYHICTHIYFWVRSMCDIHLVLAVSGELSRYSCVICVTVGRPQRIQAEVFTVMSFGNETRRWLFSFRPLSLFFIMRDRERLAELQWLGFHF